MSDATLTRAADDLQQGRLSAAIAGFEAVIATAPNTPAVWHGLGVALGLAGEAGRLFALPDASGLSAGDRITFFQNVLNELLERDALTFLMTLPDTVRMPPIDQSLRSTTPAAPRSCATIWIAPSRFSDASAHRC